MTNTSHIDKVDRLARLKAKKARAETKINEIIDELKALGNDVYEGTVVDLNIHPGTSTKVDWDALCAHCKISAKMVARFTTSKPTQVASLVGKKAR